MASASRPGSAPWASTTGFRLDGIVVAADADQIVELADRRYVGDTIVEQLRAADLVLLTKTDLAADGGSGARALVRSCTSAPVLVVVDGDVDIAVVLGIDRVDQEPPTGRPTPCPRTRRRCSTSGGRRVPNWNTW